MSAARRSLALGIAVLFVAASTAVAAAPGIYEGEVDGRRVTLKVSADGRYMTGWVAQLRLRCGGYPSLPTYPTVALDFPKTRIAKSGWLRRTWRGDRFTMKMRVKFVGRRAKGGHVSYSGPGQCVGSGDWSAKLRR